MLRKMALAAAGIIADAGTLRAPWLAARAPAASPWRQAINALKMVGFPVYPLAVSFRFNQHIADLAMECLVEVLEGKRLVHSHCYRADEMLVRPESLEEFAAQSKAPPANL